MILNQRHGVQADQPPAALLAFQAGTQRCRYGLLLAVQAVALIQPAGRQDGVQLGCDFIGSPEPAAADLIHQHHIGAQQGNDRFRIAARGL